MLLKRKVPLVFALPMLVAVVLTLFKVSYGAAEKATTKPAYVWTNEECLSCHTNQRVLALMQSKRGDPNYCAAAYKQLTSGTTTTPPGYQK